mmetsp:Transcript_2198/g.8053  ORF Transcript_2198/g.8053 Transcript_2198/m.8053 type:complete len:403 (-) Transcript_2198:1923-3131(-)
MTKKRPSPFNCTISSFSSPEFLCQDVFGNPKTIFLRLKMLSVPMRGSKNRQVVHEEISKKTFPITQYDHLDLTDSQLKDLLNFSSEQISFLKLLYLVDSESGKSIPFERDGDFVKIKTVPMHLLRHEAYYDCVMMDKRRELSEELPEEIKQEIRRDFDEILNCEYTQDELRIRWRDETERRHKNPHSGLVESGHVSPNSRGSSFVSLEEHFQDMRTLKRRRKSASAGAMLSSPKHTLDARVFDGFDNDESPEEAQNSPSDAGSEDGGITHSQIDKFYSKQMYAELDALRDTIESKKIRNPTIQQQLELQYELLSDEIEKKKEYLVKLFMEHDMNFSGSVTWDEYLCWRSKLWIDHQTKVTREKYFSTQPENEKIKPSEKILQETDKKTHTEPVTSLKERNGR